VSVSVSVSVSVYVSVSAPASEKRSHSKYCVCLCVCVSVCLCVSVRVCLQLQNVSMYVPLIFLSHTAFTYFISDYKSIGFLVYLPFYLSISLHASLLGGYGQ